LTRVDLVEPRAGVILCAVKPLDKSVNASAGRRRLTPAPIDLSPLPPSGMAPLLSQLLADYSSSGMPAAFLPTAEGDPA
jgi:hypothetical protein